MHKYIAGTFCFNPELRPDIYYTDDFETFYSRTNQELSTEDLEEWAIWLNSPWSQICESYKITYNCDNAYTQVDCNNPWKCEYTVVGYDMITASIFGYGDTEAAALQDCKNRFNALQDKYNVTDESI